ncbi:MAG: alpha/beta fold hydrolase [Bacteroidota bacterium]
MPKIPILIVCLISIQLTQTLAQNTPTLQDSTLNNLVHPQEYRTCAIGELGRVKKSGSGKQSMILIPGLGFGGDVFAGLSDRYESEYTVYSVTPAGFGGTPAPPMPDSGTTYSKLTWTNGIVTGLLNLIEHENMDKPVIIAHFVTGTQVALDLALNHPEKIGRVIIAGGSPYRYYATQVDGQWSWTQEKKYTPEERGRAVDVFWAPRWFKTVTKKTWDANMWTSEDYCRDAILGDRLFQESADVPLHVMVRYLIEWMAYDVALQYKELKTPTLVLIPDFKGILPGHDPAIDTTSANPVKAYLRYFHQETWKDARESGNRMFQFHVVPDTRLFMWYDNPEQVYRVVDAFLRE